MSVSRWLEERFYPGDDDIAMLRERLHYENLKSLTDKQLDVIRYLYMRLNIIDAKASYLLRINTLTASVITLLVSFSAKNDGISIFSLISYERIALLILALLSIAIAFLLAFAIGELEYDRITDPPIFFNQVKIQGYVDTHHCDTLPDPASSKRRFLGNYSEAEAKAIIETVQLSRDRLRDLGGTIRSLKNYEDDFFRITVARVRILHAARLFVLLGVLLSMSFVLGFALNPPAKPAQQETGTKASHLQSGRSPNSRPRSAVPLPAPTPSPTAPTRTSSPSNDPT
jgi:hypothetical protein